MHRFKLSFLSLLSFFFGLNVSFSITARAGFDLAKCPSRKIFSQVYLEAPASCKTVTAIESLASELKTFFPKPIGDVTLFLHASSYEGHTDVTRLMVLNETQMAWGHARPPEQNKLIWAHEIGHLEFNALLIDVFPPIQKFLTYLSENKKMAVAAKDPNLNTWPELKSKWNSDLERARDLQVTYSEMFADLVATLYANDSLAMKKAMASPTMPEISRAETSYYAFAGDYPIATWNTKEVHYFFAPARAHIGKTLLHWPMTAEAKKKVLQLVFDACLAEINQFWKEGGTLLNPSDANRKLINRIDQILKAQN